MVCNKLCVSQENMSTHQRLDEITVKVKEIRQLTGVRWDWMVNEATFYFWEIFIFSEHTDRFQIVFGKFIGAIKIPISALSRSKKTMEEINLWNLNHSWKKNRWHQRRPARRLENPIWQDLFLMFTQILDFSTSMSLQITEYFKMQAS